MLLAGFGLQSDSLQARVRGKTICSQMYGGSTGVERCRNPRKHHSVSSQPVSPLRPAVECTHTTEPIKVSRFPTRRL